MDPTMYNALDLELFLFFKLAFFRTLWETIFFINQMQLQMHPGSFLFKGLLPPVRLSTTSIPQGCNLGFIMPQFKQGTQEHFSDYVSQAPQGFNQLI